MRKLYFVSMNYFKLSEELYNSALAGGICEDEMRTVAEWKTDDIAHLFAAASAVRNQTFGGTVSPCTLMNIKSGACGEDCAFCTQSIHSGANVKTTPLAKGDEIVRKCKEAWNANLPFCVVSSGRKLQRDELQKVCDALKNCGGGGEKHASLGILDDEEFAMLRDAGVVCYNHNLETSRSYFNNIVTTHSYDDRVNTVRRAKRAGLCVCCGGIFGMGETWEQRIELCLALRELSVDTVPINFLNAVTGTRVIAPQEPPLELLKIVSMIRLAMPKATIKVCGGREKNLGNMQTLIFFAGANGYITGGYLTTSGSTICEDDAMLKALGLVR